MKYAISLLPVLFSIWVFSWSTLNPYTDRALIKNINGIMTKIELYESNIPIPDNKFNQYYKYIEVTEEEGLLIEPRGLSIVRNGDSYTAKIPTGLSFDAYIYYDRGKDCWQAPTPIIGLLKCSNKKS